MSLTLSTSENGKKYSKQDIKAYLGEALQVMGSSSVTKSAEKYMKEHPLDAGHKSSALSNINDLISSYQKRMSSASLMTKLKYGYEENSANKAVNTPTGRDVIKQVGEQKTVLFFDNAGSSTLGYFHPGYNVICLNKNCSNDVLQSVLIHEGEHSIQHKNLKAANYSEIDGDYTLSTGTAATRVKEADAMSSQTGFAYELMQWGDRGPWDAFAKDHKGMTETFEKNARKYGVNDNRTKQATMLAWYDDYNYVQTYDDTQIAFAEKLAKTSDIQLSLSTFRQTVPTDTLVKYVCTSNGQTYADINAHLLEQPRTKYMSDYSAKKFSKIGNTIAANGNKTEQGLGGFYKLEKSLFKTQVSTSTYGQQNVNRSIIVRTAGVSR